MIKCFIDAKGYPRAASSDREMEAVAAYLEQDIQTSNHSIELIEEAVTKVKNRTLSEWEGTGNAFTIQLTLNSVLIENEFDQSQASELSLEDFEQALSSWKSIVHLTSTD